MRSILLLSASFMLCQSALAHFIWLEPIKNADGTTTLQVYFSEDASPDDPAYLSRIHGIQLYCVSGNGAPLALELKATASNLTAPVTDDDGRSLFVATHDFGVMSRGGESFRLMYYAKTGPAITSSAWQQLPSKNHLRLDIVPEFFDGHVTVTVRFDGKPVANSEVKASGPGIDDFVGATDKEGRVSLAMADAGLYSIRAKHVESDPGKVDNLEFSETRHYSTVAVHIPAPLPKVPFKELGKIPVPVTSFGAAVIDGSLYVYGGHTGSAHSYSILEQGHQLLRMDLQTGIWDSLAEGPYLQGLALIAHHGTLYRIGGFTAKNAEGEDHDLWSQDSVAAFDPKSQAWNDLPALPEPRSSFDAAVLDGVIYVVGGWSMQGPEKTTWHHTAWQLDVKSESLTWQPMPSPPFVRRALAVAAHDGRVYAIGGMRDEGGPTRKVDVYDPGTSQWSHGPDIQGDDEIAGFGPSAFAAGGNLYVSTIKGTLQRLSENGSSWEIVGQLPTSRFFHRMLPLDGSRLLVVGGASMESGKFDTVEALQLGDFLSSAREIVPDVQDGIGASQLQHDLFRRMPLSASDR